MIKIGGGWIKTSNKDNQYIGISIDKALLPLTITDDKYLSLHLNTNKEKPEHPDYNLCLAKAED